MSKPSSSQVAGHARIISAERPPDDDASSVGFCDFTYASAECNVHSGVTGSMPFPENRSKYAEKRSTYDASRWIAGGLYGSYGRVPTFSGANLDSSNV